ncbi:class I SAM-dependent methyltransferase [Nonomuraea sp. NPDC050153]|uniref:class I SAM-dependent methyltransferase n=1 Tax=Nonomuraea sp. NPDC050153 TaxID=3364359 RepID=UPI0037AAF915
MRRVNEGPLSAALRDRGAVVTGVDASAGMLAVARRRLGDDADLHVVDLRDPLPFADGSFDDVVASLVLHYLEDWGPTLAEMRRVLRPGGRLIASVNHPFVEHLTQSPPRPYRPQTPARTAAGSDTGGVQARGAGVEESYGQEHAGVEPVGGGPARRGPGGPRTGTSSAAVVVSSAGPRAWSWSWSRLAARRRRAATAAR